MSTLRRSPTRNVRLAEPFRPKVIGPVMVFLPALPYWPAAGSAKASGLIAPLIKTGAPVYSARKGPVMDDPPSVLEMMEGVSHAPLEILMFEFRVQSFSNVPRSEERRVGKECRSRW